MSEENTASAAAGSATEGSAGGSAETGQEGAAGTAAASGGAGASPDLGWRANLPEDIRDNPALARHSDLASLAKEHVNAQALIGRKGAVIPAADAPPEDWDKFWQQVGRPESPEGYELTKPEGMDAYSDEFAGKYREAALKAGLHPKQAQALHDWWVGEFGEGAKAAQKAAEEAANGVKMECQEKWGSKMDERWEYARRGAKMLGWDAEVTDALERVAGGFKVMDALARYGEQMREGQVEGRGTAGGISPADAKAEIAKINATMADPKSALMDKFHPEHKQTVSRLEMLYGIAAGQG